MAKGKKFTAAEKHFYDKEIYYRKEVRRLEEALAAAQVTIEDLRAENASLSHELVKLMNERDEALKLSDLSLEEIQRHIKATQNVSQVFDMLTFMSKQL